MTDQDVADQVADTLLGPRVDTGCKHCRFLGYMGDYDLFFCIDATLSEGQRGYRAICRSPYDEEWNPVGENEKYMSDVLKEAKLRAIARGLV